MLRPPQQAKGDTVKVVKGELASEVVETGSVDANLVVEVKSRVAGRVAQLLVDEGVMVQKGELIAVIDPQETRLQVEQNRAQLRGAMAGVSRTAIEIQQRRETSVAQLQQARIRLAQLQRELAAQPTLTNASIRAAEASLAQAEAQRKQLVDATLPNERVALQSELDQAKSTLDNAISELNRLKNLIQKEYVSQQDVERQQLQVDLARSRFNSTSERMRRLRLQQDSELRSADQRVRQAQAELSRARANGVQDDLKQKEVETARAQVRAAEAALKDVNVLQAGRAQSQASVDQLRSVLSDSERQLRETEIRAPMDGMIAKKLIQVGELVSSLSSFSSGTPIVRLEDRSAMLVKLSVNEIDAAKLQIGFLATVTIDALPGKVFKGKVSKIAPTRLQSTNPTDSVVRFEVEVRLDERNDSIKSGMTAKVTVVTTKMKNVLVVPTEYVGTDDTRRFVLVPNKAKPKEPTKTYVQIGAESNTKTQILSGVAEGTEIVKPEYTGPKRRGMGPEVD